MNDYANGFEQKPPVCANCHAEMPAAQTGIVRYLRDTAIHIAAALAEVRQATIEECAKARCPYCRRGWPFKVYDGKPSMAHLRPKDGVGINCQSKQIFRLLAPHAQAGRE